MLNFTEDARYFLNRSENYRNIWDSKKKLMCPRSISGKLNCPVDPLLQTWVLNKENGYTEGSQYSSSNLVVSEYFAEQEMQSNGAGLFLTTYQD